MKIILSRKGFDSTYRKKGGFRCGGFASPVIADSQNPNILTMISFPIPELDEKTKLKRKYEDLVWNGKSYLNLMNNLMPDKQKSKTPTFSHCHLDPDINKSAWKNPPNGWKAAFGPQASAWSRINNKKTYGNIIEENDIILFYGWFKHAHFKDEKLTYLEGPNYQEFHCIFGYMQIGKIHKSQEEKKNFKWHPHAHYTSSEPILTATNTLILNDEKTLYPGYGTFNFCKDLVLTKQGEKKSRWSEKPFLYDCPQTKWVKDKQYYQSKSPGQEYRYDINDKNKEKEVIKWLKKIMNYRKEDS